jgi:hypothetical protein
MLCIHACFITSSIGERAFGFGSSIFRISDLQPLGFRLLIVGGKDAGAAEAAGAAWHAEAYDA